MTNVVRDAENLGSALRNWRRALHANPELSGQEEQTAAFVARELRAMGYEPRERIGGEWGLTADLHVASGPLVALRADMDALPIHEETGLEFASKNPGVMHACGHDAHTAMLLAAARMLRERKNELRRSVRFVFQPHEEKYPGGAPGMIRGGVLENVESIFGVHIISVIPKGIVAAREGPFMAAVNQLHIVVHGKGGHAAMPEDAIDPVVISAQIITALQTIVSRSIAPHDTAVVSVTCVEAGTADNVIPSRVVLRGTIRTFDENVRQRVLQRVREIAAGIAAACGARAEVTLGEGYPVLLNDAATLSRAKRAAESLGGGLIWQNLPLQGGGEDFAYYGKHVPAAFVFVGAKNEPRVPCFPHHHARFDIDEDAMPLGAALLAQYALEAGR
ncbi:MAG: amidohydrolase [Phycisphaerales bacterium]|nr:amidohydrolase [Phycisphaerales bacterium]